MVRHHLKSLWRDLRLALRGRTPWYEVRYHWSSLISDITYPFRAFCYGIGNLCAYAPLLWYDRDFDQDFMLKLWAKKFDRMAAHHLQHGNHVGHEVTARQLRVCAALCRRIDANEYEDIPMAAHDAKWGKSHFVFLPTGHGTSELRFNRLNVRDDKSREQERREFMAIMDAAERQRARDLEALTAMIRKHALTWWD